MPSNPSSVQRRLRTGLAVAISLVLVLAGCGDDDGGGREDAGAAPTSEGWTSTVLEGEVGAESPPVLTTDGEQLVLAWASEDGVLTGYASDDDRTLVAGEPNETGLYGLSLGGAARLGDGWVAVGSGGDVEVDDDRQLLYQVHAFGSDDGRTWTDLGATGFGGPADVFGVVAVDDGLVAVGTARTYDPPSHGGFLPVAWHSADGRRWTRIALPMDGASEGRAGNPVVVDGRILVTGSLDRRAATWESTDGGATWAVLHPEGMGGAGAVSDIVVLGDRLVANASGGDEEGSALVVSDDGGRRWARAGAPPPPSRGETASTPLFSGGDRVFTSRYSFVDVWPDPTRCYADIELCRSDVGVALYVSDDGDSWARVDTSGIGEGEEGEVDDLIGLDDGTLVALTRSVDGLVASTWTGGPLPTEDEPVDPRADLVLLPEGEAPEVGVRYAVPLFVHCGMDWLYLGEQPWQRTDAGRDTESGAGDPIPDDWPVAREAILGFATLQADGTIEYSIGPDDDPEVVATYGPPTEEPPGCM